MFIFTVRPDEVAILSVTLVVGVPSVSLTSWVSVSCKLWKPASSQRVLNVKTVKYNVLPPRSVSAAKNS